ncbi:hypothetical protein [Streptomyces sp. NPDC047928]|uniref:hypothetical protein n=1 Tax=Streptomyces sp. NPDC047928 TaxID=3365492 RepID=UPI003716A420
MSEVELAFHAVAPVREDVTVRPFEQQGSFAAPALAQQRQREKGLGDLTGIPQQPEIRQVAECEMNGQVIPFLLAHGAIMHVEFRPTGRKGSQNGPSAPVHQ